MGRWVAILDCGSGNLRSVAKAFERAAAGAVAVRVTAAADDLADSSHIVLPGVGAFGDCMRGLNARPGLREALEHQVLENRKPFLGICVGMQMLFSRGLEFGEHPGLGWIEGEVRSLTPADPFLKIPHMGWNELSFAVNHPLFQGIPNGAHAYFVHSYHAVCANASERLATVDYGGTVTAAVARGNIMGTQFHPEKSQETGLRLLANFLSLR